MATRQVPRPKRRRLATRPRTLGYWVMEITDRFELFPLHWHERTHAFYIGWHITVFPTRRRAQRAIQIATENPKGTPWNRLEVRRAAAEQ